MGIDENMSENWASENLRTIRTLMERTAVYRRALAPVSLVTGIVGVTSGAAGMGLGVNTAKSFVVWWLVTGVIALVLAFVLVRKQALRADEALWSPPTRRVAEALAPSLVSGLIVGLTVLGLDVETGRGISFIPVVWMLFFGSALHSAGFFMRRGIRLLGWIFTATAVIEAAVLIILPDLRNSVMAAHGIMGGVFGGYNLVYCLYLYLTEKEDI